jgi:hypothetical protein
MRATRLTFVVLILALTLGVQGTHDDRAAVATSHRNQPALAGAGTDGSLIDVRTNSFWQGLRRNAERSRGGGLPLALVAAASFVLGLRHLWPWIQRAVDVHVGIAICSSSSRSPPSLAAI